MAKEITVVMIGEDVDVRGEIVATHTELSIMRDFNGVPKMALNEADVVTELEYELGNFVVNLGDNKLVTGYYPYFTSEDWMDIPNYGGFYFGDLMVKIDEEWYNAEWVDPDSNHNEMVTFTRMDTKGDFMESFCTALINAAFAAAKAAAAV